jgi:hypothetical protein
LPKIISDENDVDFWGDLDAPNNRMIVSAKQMGMKDRNVVLLIIPQIFFAKYPKN